MDIEYSVNLRESFGNWPSICQIWSCFLPPTISIIRYRKHIYGFIHLCHTFPMCVHYRCANTWLVLVLYITSLIREIMVFSHAYAAMTQTSSLLSYVVMQPWSYTYVVEQCWSYNYTLLV